MKRKLLFISSILLAGASFGQLTQANEPAIGASLQMYLCDSNATHYESTTGTGVTWDYSNILGVSGQQQLVEVIDPTTHPNASDFPTSTKAISAGGSLTNFFNSSATERLSQGFVYNEPSFGEVVCQFDVDPAKTHQYPMSQGVSFTDDFEGQMTFEFSGAPMNPATTGNSDVIMDGEGTLLLPQSTSLTNVLRYKSIDSIFFNVAMAGDLEVIRTAYDYYHIGTSNLPVFTILNIKIQTLGSSTPISEQTIVLSSVEPTDFLGVNEMNADQLYVYPNPSNGSLKINGLNEVASVKIIDFAGRTLKSFSQVNNGQVLDLSDINAGAYMISINNGSSMVNKQIIVQ